MFTILTLNFLLFCIGALVVYYLLPWRARSYWLLAASLVFFVLSCGWKMLPYLAYGILVTYFGARVIARCKTERMKRAALVVTLALVVVELFALKYLNFFISTGNIFAKLFRIPLGLETVSIVGPIGISYYTLSIIGYVINVYWNTSKPQTNVFKYSLFVCYFPQMTSGPITRYEAMEEQLFSRHDYNYTTVAFGFQRIVWGFFKKLVIADRLAPLISAVYGNHAQYGGFYIVFATICYAFRLYTDFSGCMDIVLGVSEAFGIRLPENFNAPFLSENLSEFWRRWHITLGTWTKDYLFYPILKSNTFQKIGNACRKRLGKKRGKNIPTYIGLFIIWLIIGIWHGGTYRYLFAAGILPCFYLVTGQVLNPLFIRIARALKVNTECFSFRLYRVARTFLLMCFLWIFACSASLLDGIHVVKHMVSTFNPWVLLDGSLLNLGLDWQDFALLFVSLLIVFAVDHLHRKGMRLREALAGQNIAFQWVFVMTAVFAVIIFGIYGSGYNPVDFIYGGF